VLLAEFRDTVHRLQSARRGRCEARLRTARRRYTTSAKIYSVQITFMAAVAAAVFGRVIKITKNDY
jgi:hypothetical protein